jgi:hypothetical protein
LAYRKDKEWAKNLGEFVSLELFKAERLNLMALGCKDECLLCR